MYMLRESWRDSSRTPSQHVVFMLVFHRRTHVPSNVARERTTAAPPPGGMSRGMRFGFARGAVQGHRKRIVMRGFTEMIGGLRSHQNSKCASNNARSSA